MDKLNEFVNRYVATWNEPDAERRRKCIAEFWTEDGVHLSKTIETRGHEAIEARSAGTYEHWVKGRGFVFKTRNDAVGHHNVVKFSWEMVPSGCGQAVSAAIDFLVLADDGRIRLGAQFADTSPS